MRRRNASIASAAAMLALAVALSYDVTAGASAREASATSIPRHVRSDLLADVKCVLVHNYLRRAWGIEAVLTTEERVLKLEHQTIPAGFTNRGVYLVAFQYETQPAKGPARYRRMRSLNVVELTIPAATPAGFSPEDAIFVERDPDVRALGVPMLLSNCLGGVGAICPGEVRPETKR